MKVTQITSEQKLVLLESSDLNYPFFCFHIILDNALIIILLFFIHDEFNLNISFILNKKWISLRIVGQELKMNKKSTVGTNFSFFCFLNFVVI